MGEGKQLTKKMNRRWILFFYSVPSKPVSNRMAVWRKLMKAGAIQLKGSVYILPFSAEHYEFFQWLVNEAKDMGGDAALVVIDGIDTMSDEEIISLFNQSRRDDYLPLVKKVDEINRKWTAARKGGGNIDIKKLGVQFNKVHKSYTDVQTIDFFSTTEGLKLKNSMDKLRDELQQWPGPSPKRAEQIRVSRKSAENYRRRTWVTRVDPFVDRMASAWLIKRFIDPEASFAFADAGNMPKLTDASVAYDMFEGEFTHCGDLCTFEVLIRAFGLKGKALNLLAEVVHNLDIKDDKYQVPEAQGVEGILSGIRKSAKDDSDALHQGMQIFEALYISKK